MPENDCSPGGRTPDGSTMQGDGFTMENNGRTTQNYGFIMSNVRENICDKVSRMQKLFLDGIPSVKETLCGMWNVFTAHARWRSGATIDAVLKSIGSKPIASNSKASAKLQPSIKETGKNAKVTDDEYGTEDMIARRNLVSNQTLSALIGLASYAWVCVFVGWMVSEILAAVFRTEVPELGVLLDADPDRYDSYVNQFSMKLQALIATIIPPLYLVSWVLVAILFTKVTLFPVEFTNVIPAYSSTIASSIASAIPASIIPIAGASRAIAWTINAALTCTSRVRTMVARRWSSNLMVTMQLCVFMILFVAAIWSYLVVRMMDPGFVPENEWPYKGDPFGSDHFIPHYAFSNFDVLGSSHTPDTQRLFEKAHALGTSTLGSFQLVGNSDRRMNINGNSDRMINMKGCHLWYWDDPEIRLKVAKQWEKLATSQSSKNTAEDSASIRKSKWKRFPDSSANLAKNGLSNTFINDTVITNTSTTQVSNPFDREISDANIDISLDMDVRDTKTVITSGETIDSGDIDNAAGKSGEFTNHHLSLYDQKILYNMAVSHYFGTVFSDNDRMLASGIPYHAGNSESANSTGYSAGHNSTGYINPAGHSPAGYIINSAWHSSRGYINDPAGYIQRHGDYDTTRDMQHPIKNKRIHTIQYDPFRRIFVPYGAQYSGLHDKYVVGLQAYPPFMMKWLSGFVGKPIGFRNQKAFSLFLLYSGMLSCYVLMVLGVKMLIWNPKSIALTGTKEPQPLNEELDRGLLQESSRKEQKCIVTKEDFTVKVTENDRKISISDEQSNITDNNYNVDGHTTLEKDSITDCDSATYIEQRGKANKIPLVWCLFHGICSVYMIICFVPEMQDGFLNALNMQNAIENPNSAGINRSLNSILCSLLPHEACLGINTIEDYVRSNQGGGATLAGMKVMRPYPSTHPVPIHLASFHPVPSDQSFLQEYNVHYDYYYPPAVQPHQQAVQVQPLGQDRIKRQPLPLREGSTFGGPAQFLPGNQWMPFAFDGVGTNNLHCQIRHNEPRLQQVFESLRKTAADIFQGIQNKVPVVDQEWEFKYLGKGANGVAFHMAGSPMDNREKNNNCKGFITKVQMPGADAQLTDQNIKDLGLNKLQLLYPNIIRIPLYPEPNYARLFGRPSTVSFAVYGAGGEVADRFKEQKKEFFKVFFRSLPKLMSVVSAYSVSPGIIHRDIKTANLVFTTKEADATCEVAIIDWDGVMRVEEHMRYNDYRGGFTAAYSAVNTLSFIKSDGRITTKYVLKPNDEYALVLCGASAIMGHSDIFQPDFLRFFGKGFFAPVPVVIPEIPKLLHMLDQSKYFYNFPTVDWGIEWNPNNPRKVDTRVWKIFIRSYLVLWDINSVLKDPNEYPGPASAWIPPKHCFLDNHVVVTFSNLLSKPSPDINDYAESSQTFSHCNKHWKYAHESLKCLWKTTPCKDLLGLRLELWEQPDRCQGSSNGKWPLAFDGVGTNDHHCQIRCNEPDLQEVFNSLRQTVARIFQDTRGRKRGLEGPKWEFKYLGKGTSGVAFHMARSPMDLQLNNHCNEFITKVQKPNTPVELTDEKIRQLRLRELQRAYPDIIRIPLYPQPDYAHLFGSPATVSFAIYGAGGEVKDKFEKRNIQFFVVFLRNLVKLMRVVSKYSKDPAIIHRDIKPGNLVFTTKEPGDKCEVAIIDWDAVIGVADHKVMSYNDLSHVRGTPVYMAVTTNIVPGRLAKEYVLRPNDEYALVLCGASAILGQRDIVIDEWPPQPPSRLVPEGYMLSSSTIDIPIVINMLEDPKFDDRFPKVEWGTQWTDMRDPLMQDRTKLWILFIRSYLVLWDINSVLKDPNEYLGPAWIPPKHCFLDNHVVVTFQNLLYYPDLDNSQYVQTGALPHCKKHWTRAHKSLNCLWNASDYETGPCKELVSLRRPPTVATAVEQKVVGRRYPPYPYSGY